MLLLLEGYRRLLEQLAWAAPQWQLADLSQELSGVRAEVLRSIEDTESERLSPVESEDPEDTLAALITERRWAQVARHLHRWGWKKKKKHSNGSDSPSFLSPGRHQGPGEEEEELWAVLGAYCQHLGSGQRAPPFFAVTHPEPDLAVVGQRLRELSLQLSSALHALGPGPDTHVLDTSLFRKSDC